MKGQLVVASPKGDSLVMEYETEKEIEEANKVLETAKQNGFGVVDDQGTAIEKITPEVQTNPICGACYRERPISPARCPEKPEALLGQPIGMYHCPYCMAMLCAGVPHPDLCDECQPKEIRNSNEQRPTESKKIKQKAR